MFEAHIYIVKNKTHLLKCFILINVYYFDYVWKTQYKNVKTQQFCGTFLVCGGCQARLY